jgi:hypothetical protein
MRAQFYMICTSAMVSVVEFCKVTSLQDTNSVEYGILIGYICNYCSAENLLFDNIARGSFLVG